MSSAAPSSVSDFGPAVYQTDLALPGLRRGKVRDVYPLPVSQGLPGGGVLLVASDRISAFDVVMPTPIAGKGQLLTRISTHWLRFIERQGICRTHLISDDAALVPYSAFKGATTRADLRGRVMIGRRCQVIPVECVVRGYIEGSGWKDYQATGSICGEALPPGLRQCDKLPRPIFTPATKEEVGTHDENISFDAAAKAVGQKVMTFLRDRSLAIYAAASAYAAECGIIIADTKFEFGLELDAGGKPTGAEPILIDEALTPDSSRFWPAADYQPGRAQKSYDKQFLREYLEELTKSGKWNKQAPGPVLPEDVEPNRAKYAEAVELLTLRGRRGRKMLNHGGHGEH